MGVVIDDPYGLDPESARRWAIDLGLPGFRGQQLFDGLWGASGQSCQGESTDWTDLPGLPATLCRDLAAVGPLRPAQEIASSTADDGTCKTLLELRDGRQIECVSIPTAQRHTVCVSTQVGCAVGCSFCASGLDGVERSLTAGEIAFQVLFHHRRRPVSNVVCMGSGEPFFNYDALLQAIRVLGHPRGLGLGRRRFTISTAGVPERIRQLAEDEPQVTLALSLHAADDQTRSRLVPLNRRFPLAELMAAMDAYADRVKRRITLEYVLLADANMRDEQAKALGRLARRHRAHVNLIPFNALGPEAVHRAPQEEDIRRFAKLVCAQGVQVTRRCQRGADIDAACGQLRRRIAGEWAKKNEGRRIVDLGLPGHKLDSRDQHDLP